MPFLRKALYVDYIFEMTMFILTFYMRKHITFVFLFAGRQKAGLQTAKINTADSK